MDTSSYCRGEDEEDDDDVEEMMRCENMEKERRRNMGKRSVYTLMVEG